MYRFGFNTFLNVRHTPPPFLILPVPSMVFRSSLSKLQPWISTIGSAKLLVNQNSEIPNTCICDSDRVVLRRSIFFPDTSNV